MWKAFEELEGLGWIDGSRPRMISVQVEGCAPVVRAIERGDERVEPWEEARTAASGLRVPSLFADRLVLRAIRESGGTAVAVEESQIQQARRELGEVEGILACYEGAATLAGLQVLLEQGIVSADERVVLFNTGTGLKDVASL
jgi:threonine synthase